METASQRIIQREYIQGGWYFINHIIGKSINVNVVKVLKAEGGVQAEKKKNIEQ